MNKKIIIIIAVIALLALAIPAFAATVNEVNSEQIQKINNLHKQILELRMQMLDEWQNAGEITAEQATSMKNNIQKRMDYLEENPNAVGPMGKGRGFGNGAKGNCCGHGGWGNCYFNQQTSSAQ